ncbi:DsbA family protein [Patescibacteria group bacterium]|nr:DsbA family protein [Patescibacteria group bacterium]
MKKILPLLLSLYLAACVQVQQTQAPQDVEVIEPSEKRTEETDKLEIADLISGTGALAERLLATGIIDIGKRDAPVTVLLFTEHHARYAREFQLEQFPRLLKDFIEPGLLRFQIVILPLKKYPQSEPAAKGLLCSAMQGKGIAMHQLLSEKLDKERLEPEHYAQELELDMEEFSKCTEAEETSFVLAQQKAWAQSLDVSLVPTLFINGEKHVGLPYYADLKGMINQLIE